MKRKKRDHATQLADTNAEIHARIQYGSHVLLNEEYLPYLSNHEGQGARHARPETFWDRQIYGRR